MKSRRASWERMGMCHVTDSDHVTVACQAAHCTPPTIPPRRPSLCAMAVRQGMVGSGQRVTLLGLLCLFCALLQMCKAHMIELEPSAKECFFEDLNPSDQVCIDAVWQ